jgi:hypothetical protein
MVKTYIFNLGVIGSSDGAAFSNDDVKAAYEARGKNKFL